MEYWSAGVLDDWSIVPSGCRYFKMRNDAAAKRRKLMDSGQGTHIRAASHTSQPATPRVRRMQITALTLLVISGAR